MRRRKKNCLKNKILKVITGIMSCIACLGVMMLDSENLVIPLSFIAVSFIWIALFALANSQ